MLAYIPYMDPMGNSLVSYPLVICYIAVENGTFIVDLPIKDDDFP